ncbi:MAG: hypothetical protein VXX54_06205, partial [Candidatus Thermoplasmatota archaeon]|nr:hypothetical protein [Candidatus Thermoplasmatota archaeon]
HGRCPLPALAGVHALPEGSAFAGGFDPLGVGHLVLWFLGTTGLVGASGPARAPFFLSNCASHNLFFSYAGGQSWLVASRLDPASEGQMGCAMEEPNRQDT